MKKNLKKEFTAQIPVPTLTQDTHMAYATNSLIINNNYSKNDESVLKSKVEDAKAWVDENHK